MRPSPIADGTCHASLPKDKSNDQAASNPSLNLESIHPNYFSTIEAPIVRGRPFSAADRQGTVDVAIVSEDVASRLWPGQNPIGKRLKMGRVEGSGRWLEVVGVAATTRYRTVTTPRPTLYLPAAQFQMTATMLIVRSTASLELLMSVARERIRAIDPNVMVLSAAPFADYLDRPLGRPRFNAFLIGVFGIAALLLSTLGLYAVMAAHVRQRDREIAVRLALGATGANVRRLVLRGGWSARRPRRTARRRGRGRWHALPARPVVRSAADGSGDDRRRRCSVDRRCCARCICTDASRRTRRRGERSTQSVGSQLSAFSSALRNSQ